MADLPPTDPKPRSHTIVVAIEIGKRGANIDEILLAIRECEGVTDADKCATFEHGETVREEKCSVMVAADDGVPLKKFNVTINRDTVYEVMATDAEKAKTIALDGDGDEVHGETLSVEAEEDTDDPKDGDK